MPSPPTFKGLDQLEASFTLDGLPLDALFAGVLSCIRKRRWPTLLRFISELDGYTSPAREVLQQHLAATMDRFLATEVCFADWPTILAYNLAETSRSKAALLYAAELSGLCLDVKAVVATDPMPAKLLEPGLIAPFKYLPPARWVEGEALPATYLTARRGASAPDLIISAFLSKFWKQLTLGSVGCLRDLVIAAESCDEQRRTFIVHQLWRMLRHRAAKLFADDSHCIHEAVDALRQLHDRATDGRWGFLCQAALLTLCAADVDWAPSRLGEAAQRTRALLLQAPERPNGIFAAELLDFTTKTGRRRSHRTAQHWVHEDGALPNETTRWRVAAWRAHYHQFVLRTAAQAPPPTTVRRRVGSTETLGWGSVTDLCDTDEQVACPDDECRESDPDVDSMSLTLPTPEPLAKRRRLDLPPRFDEQSVQMLPEEKLMANSGLTVVRYQGPMGTRLELDGCGVVVISADTWQARAYLLLDALRTRLGAWSSSPFLFRSKLIPAELPLWRRTEEPRLYLGRAAGATAASSQQLELARRAQSATSQYFAHAVARVVLGIERPFRIEGMVLNDKGQLVDGRMHFRLMAERRRRWDLTGLAPATAAQWLRDLRAGGFRRELDGASALLAASPETEPFWQLADRMQLHAEHQGDVRARLAELPVFVASQLTAVVATSRLR